MKLGRKVFREVNVSDHPEAIPDLRAVSGGTSVPVAVQGGRVVWAMKFG